MTFQRGEVNLVKKPLSMQSLGVDHDDAVKASEKYIREHNVLLADDIELKNIIAFSYIRDVDSKQLWAYMAEIGNGLLYIKNFMTYVHIVEDNKKNRKKFEEEPFHDPLPKTGKQHGIDLNLIELLNDSDGEASENMRFYQRAQRKLAKQQRRLSRRQEHAKKNRKLQESSNYQKQRKKVASIHRQISRQREEYLHTLSKREVENQDFIAAEDLQVKSLIKNHYLAKSIADAGWRKLLTMLQYKAVFYGKTVILVPPQNTTQTCSNCGYVMKGENHLP